ncbi:hypothetical protein [Paeniglutamicibacter psychrophenolicus]|uniref:hypothetical protein n=1 Tax=Paeniglutamicibacter psychrophenolicus TaxID=257454 RepID=UPI002788451D|nr:hypothetical protein [Paeniglutamicibacter psychrophenolicus]MDQ0094607.1 hypothetical protein [Paeniglutamicibacter psychrophenolicus]
MGQVPLLEIGLPLDGLPPIADATSEGTAEQPVWSQNIKHARLTFFANELLEVDFHPRTVLSVETVRELWGLADARLERKVKYLLVDVCGIDSVKPNVTALIDPMTEGMRTALLGSGPADRVLARFFMRKVDPARRYMYVESRQDALAFFHEDD